MEPTETNMRKAFMHLTNYSLNKYSETFEVGLSVDLGSKRYDPFPLCSWPYVALKIHG